MTVDKEMVVTAKCDLESCGADVDLDDPATCQVGMDVMGPNMTKVGTTQYCFCTKAHCNTWWNNATGQPLIP